MTDTPQISRHAYTSNAVGADILWGSPVAENAVMDFLNVSELMKRQQNQTEIMATATRRVVQVFIADPNENVPLEHSVLFRGDQKLTDLTDTELFFEVPMSDILKSHNDKRVKFVDKEATKRAGKDVLLDAVKIRDLKMVVVTVAQF